MLLLVPQALALTIPMSLLLGLLIAFSRLSADREFVAMQACGMSLARLLRPVGSHFAALCRRHLSTSGRSSCPTATSASARSRSTSWRSGPNTTCARASSSTTSPTWFCTCATSPPPAAAGPACSFPTGATRRRRPSTWRVTAASPSTRTRRSIELVLEAGARHTASTTRHLRGVPVRSSRPVARSAYGLPGSAGSRREAR